MRVSGKLQFVVPKCQSKILLQLLAALQSQLEGLWQVTCALCWILAGLA